MKGISLILQICTLALLNADVCLHAQGNKWTCPEADAIAVCQNLDEAQLGNLTCADRTGLANSATSRHAVLDMLSITHGSDCPALEDVRLSRSSHLSTHAQSAARSADPESKAAPALTVTADLCPSLQDTSQQYTCLPEVA